MAKKEHPIPVSSEEIVETHCHLDYLKDVSLEELIPQIHEVMVTRMLTIGVAPDHLDSLISLAENLPGVFAAQGIHPHHAGLWNEEVKENIEKNLNHPRVVAYGEIGLDYHYNFHPRETQLKVFEKQIEIATQYQLPIVIHSREAEEDTMSIIKNYAQALKNKAVVHSFSSKTELAECALEYDLYLGINGMVTFKNAKNIQEIVPSIPLTSLLVETDSPFLAPTPMRGHTNTPRFLPFVVQKIAEIKNSSFEEVAKQTTSNALTLFSKMKPT